MDSRRRTIGSSSHAQRDQPQAPPQQPQSGNIYNEVIFENIAQQAWYDAHFLIKTIIPKRPVIYEDYVKFVAPAYDCLVREFYSNVEITGER